MQAPPGPQMTRTQKLAWLAGQLMTDAAKFEQSGDFEIAIKDYLQAVDLLLLLSKAEQSYTPWKNYTDKAEYCHKKVRLLIAKQSLAEEKGAAPAQTASPAPQPAPPAALPGPSETR